MGRVSASRATGGGHNSVAGARFGERKSRFFAWRGTCTSSAFQRNKAALQTANNTPFCVFLSVFFALYLIHRRSGRQWRFEKKRAEREKGRKARRGDKWHRI
jgi:hypothetical protein